MLYLFKCNFLRVIFACLLLLIGIVLMFYVILFGIDSIIINVVSIFIFCSLISISFRLMFTVFSKVEGNYENYTLKPYLNSKIICLSKMYYSMGMQLKCIDKVDICVLNKIAKELCMLPVVIAKPQKQDYRFRYRTRSLSSYINLYFLKRNKESYKQLRRKTYMLLQEPVNKIIISPVDYMEVVTDQILIGCNLCIEDTILSSARYLIQDENSFIKYDTVSLRDRFNGLCLNVLFITDGNMVIEDRCIQRYFQSYICDNGNTLEQFCNAQIRHHLSIYNLIGEAETEFLGYALNIENAGAPVLVCLAKISQYFENTVCMQTLEYFLKNKVKDENTAMLKYFIKEKTS